MESFRITKIRDGIKDSVDDLVAEEVPFTINLRDKELVTLLCSPLALEDLARGFLFTSGLIKDSSEIKEIVIDNERWSCRIEAANHGGDDLVFKRLYTSGCGRGTLFYNALDIMHRSKIISQFQTESALLAGLMPEFQKRSDIYLKTGGVHSAALADGSDILIFREDIGRHNAIDKVIGAALSENISFEDKILVTSGRISSDVIFKVKRCGVPVIISRSAPTNQAVRLANEMGITLAGFVRGKRINIYSGHERVR